VRQYRALLMAVTAGIAAPACVKAATSGPAASPTPAVVHVDLTDNQTTVTLRIGDSLVLDLPIPPKGEGWTLLDWPRDILGSPPILGGPARFPYTFIARQTGEDRIVAINRNGCDGIRALAPPACAAVPDLSQLRPELLFLVTIRVVP
jgi:hypothetical protein